MSSGDSWAASSDFKRVNPPICPVKQPHGTSRPRVSPLKKMLKDAGGAAFFFPPKTKHAAMTAAASAMTISQVFNTTGRKPARSH